jgi:hypothetical protein
MDKVQTEHQLSGITTEDLRRGLADVLPPGARITFAMSQPALEMGGPERVLLRWRAPEEAA